MYDESDGRGIRLYGVEYAHGVATVGGARRGAAGRLATWAGGAQLLAARSESVCGRIRSRRQAANATDGARAAIHGRNPGAGRCGGCAGHRAVSFAGGASAPALWPSWRQVALRREISRGTLGCSSRAERNATTFFAHRIDTMRTSLIRSALLTCLLSLACTPAIFPRTEAFSSPVARELATPTP